MPKIILSDKWLYSLRTDQIEPIIHTHTHTHSYFKTTTVQWLLNAMHSSSQRLRRAHMQSGTFLTETRAKEWKHESITYSATTKQRRAARLTATVHWTASRQWHTHTRSFTTPSYRAVDCSSSIRQTSRTPLRYAPVTVCGCIRLVAWSNNNENVSQCYKFITSTNTANIAVL